MLVLSWPKIVVPFLCYQLGDVYIKSYNLFMVTDDALITLMIHLFFSFKVLWSILFSLQTRLKIYRRLNFLFLFFYKNVQKLIVSACRTVKRREIYLHCTPLTNLAYLRGKHDLFTNFWYFTGKRVISPDFVYSKTLRS